MACREACFRKITTWIRDYYMLESVVDKGHQDIMTDWGLTLKAPMLIVYCRLRPQYTRPKGARLLYILNESMLQLLIDTPVSVSLRRQSTTRNVKHDL